MPEPSPTSRSTRAGAGAVAGTSGAATFVVAPRPLRCVAVRRGRLRHRRGGEHPRALRLAHRRQEHPPRDLARKRDLPAGLMNALHLHPFRLAGRITSSSAAVAGSVSRLPSAWGRCLSRHSEKCRCRAKRATGHTCCGAATSTCSTQVALVTPKELDRLAFESHDRPSYHD